MSQDKLKEGIQRVEDVVDTVREHGSGLEDTYKEKTNPKQRIFIGAIAIFFLVVLLFNVVSCGPEDVATNAPTIVQ